MVLDYIFGHVACTLLASSIASFAELLEEGDGEIWCLPHLHERILSTNP